ncbi:hypothetical protein ACHAQA_003425 [Verticillium albo-atrum]
MAEAIGLGASVLAFITITLKSAKAIHVVLSTIKDAPDSVRRLLSEVLFMQSMLERLLSFTSPQIQTIPASEVSALNHLVKGCSVDISDIATRLHDIIVFPGTDAARRLLKRLRAAQGDKDLVRMTDTLRGQASKLQLYLTMIHTQTAATQAAARAAEAAVQANSMSQIMEQLIGLRQQVDAGKTALRPELSDVIARLARLSREEMRVVDVEDIEPVMTDFQELLKATLDERLPLQPIGSDWPFIRALAPAEFSKDVKLFQKLFAAASRVSLNGVVHNSEFEELYASIGEGADLKMIRFLLDHGLDVNDTGGVFNE